MYYEWFKYFNLHLTDEEIKQYYKNKKKKGRYERGRKNKTIN